MNNPPNLALDKSLTLLSLLVSDGGEHSVSTLAEEAGVPPATAHRIVATFERRGFVSRVARGRYLAGPALIRLANGASLNKVIELTSRPAVEALAKQTGLTAHLGVFEGDMVTYLIKAGRSGGGLFTREGMQLEAYCSAIGKMLLAHLPEEQRERYLGNGSFVALTPNTITDVEKLRAELARVRTQGFARDEREIDANLRCIAVSVNDNDGAAIAALSLSARQQHSECDPAAHLEPLRAAVLVIEQRLFPKSQ